MNYINPELERLKKSLRIQNYLFLGMFLIVLIAPYLSYKLGENSEKSKNIKTDYQIELLKFDTIQVKTKTGEVHRISLDELEDLIISNEI